MALTSVGYKNYSRNKLILLRFISLSIGVTSVTRNIYTCVRKKDRE